MKLDPLNPAGWKQPKGYSNGVVVKGAGKMLYVAGQIAWDADQRLVGAGDFAAQFRQALTNVVALVNEAGGWPDHIVDMTIYVTDKHAYLSSVKQLGETWRELVGKHYPAMALVQVADLLEDGALVEIQAVAALR